jgi:hypothetical protein
MAGRPLPASLNRFAADQEALRLGWRGDNMEGKRSPQ